MNTDDLNTTQDNDLEQEVNLEATTDSTNANDSEEIEEFVIDEEGDMSQTEVIKKLRAKLKTAVEEKQNYLTNWQRDKAEFINIRKRDDESKADYLKFATQKVIEDILPVLDSFDLAMSNTTAWESVSKEWRAGIEGIYQQLQSTLAKYDVASFTQVGDMFDPNLHHSIATVIPEEKGQDHAVAEILQKGYKIKDKVLRPALVKVFELSA